MWRVVKAILAAIGVVVVFLLAVRMCMPWLFEGVEQSMRREFGSHEAVYDLEAIFSRLERSPHDAALGPAYTKSNSMKTRRVPRSWMPQRFSTWGRDGSGDVFVPGEVMAHYDASDSLVALEFFGRHTCIVSRDASYLPSQFRTLYRVAERPIWVTVRIL